NEIAKEMQTKKIEEKSDICKSNSNVSAFPLLCGWALKHNQKYGKKGSGKRIAPQVIALLERFFLDGNVHKNRRMNGYNMRDKLVEKQENGELARDIEIPEVTSINNWIARFAAKSKKDLSEQAIADTLPITFLPASESYSSLYQSYKSAIEDDITNFTDFSMLFKSISYNRKQLDVTTAGSVVNTLIKDLDEQMFMHNNGYRFKNRSRPWNKRNTNRYEYNYEDQSINNWGGSTRAMQILELIMKLKKESENISKLMNYFLEEQQKMKKESQGLQLKEPITSSDFLSLFILNIKCIQKQ
ncbi:21621_t:CDS:2, partial [Rhizophagus irregularis]